MRMSHVLVGAFVIAGALALNILDTNDDIKGKKITTLLTLETVDGEPLDVFKELTKDNSIRKRDDIIMRIGQDDLLRLEATFAPVQSSSGTSAKADSYVLIIRDITRMKSLEEERDEFPIASTVAFGMPTLPGPTTRPQIISAILSVTSRVRSSSFWNMSPGTVTMPYPDACTVSTRLPAGMLRIVK